MKKFTGALLVTTDEAVIGYALDMQSATGVIKDYIDNELNDSEKASWVAKEDIYIYPIISDATSMDIETQKGELDLDELSENTPDTYELEVTRGGGYLYGETYRDEDSLASAVKDAYESGDLTFEEIENMEVKRTLVEYTSYEHMEEPEDEIVFKDAYGEKYNELNAHAGSTFINENDLAVIIEEAITEFKAKQASEGTIVIHDTPADVYGDEELAHELNQLDAYTNRIMERKHLLRKELKNRAEVDDAVLNSGTGNDLDKDTF